MEESKFIELTEWQKEIQHAQAKLKGKKDPDSQRHYEAHERLLKKLQGQLTPK